MTFYEALLGIEIPAEFGAYEESSGVTSPTEDYIDKVYALAKEHNVEIDYAYGVSQLAFIIEGADTVVKVAFKGMMEEWEDYDEETGEIKEDAEWHEAFNPFDLDYCSKAYEFYNLACEEGVEEFFAKMDILGRTFTNDIVWTQSFVTPLSAERTSSKKASEDSLKKAKEMEQERFIPFDKEWIALAIDCYGEKKLKNFLAFLEEHDIHDFHYGNYGYTKDGLPQVLDYSSWG